MLGLATKRDIKRIEAKIEDLMRRENTYLIWNRTYLKYERISIDSVIDKLLYKLNLKIEHTPAQDASFKILIDEGPED